MVHLGGVNRQQLADAGVVSWVGDFRPEWKVDATLGRRVHATPWRRALAEGVRWRW